MKAVPEASEARYGATYDLTASGGDQTRYRKPLWSDTVLWA